MTFAYFAINANGVSSKQFVVNVFGMINCILFAFICL